MSYFKTCPHCGAHLDPGEKCDCQEEKAAQGANNTRDGRAQQVLTDTVDAFSVNEKEKNCKHDG